jgi:hypothetical protein
MYNNMYILYIYHNMKQVKLFEEFSKWYRGYNINTRNLPYKWISSDKKLANSYSEITSITQGGKSILDEIDIDLNTENILDLTIYDMDDMMSEDELWGFVIDVDSDFKYDDLIDLFDFTEDEIPLSRLVNKIISDILSNYDGFKIMESEIETACVKQNILK